METQQFHININSTPGELRDIADKLERYAKENENDKENSWADLVSVSVRLGKGSINFYWKYKGKQCHL